ncbi:MAG: Alfa-L-rhamnosidase, partial [Phycisphaerales bacterium]|nr:Alfa-L-rhamnosidase [Phycisphaerales bacterium]
RLAFDPSAPDLAADNAWSPVKVRTDGLPPVIEAQVMEPVRELMTLPAKTLKQPQPGHWLFDMGQNMVGVPRLTLNAPAGTRVTIKFAEMLDPDGTIYTTNYRGAKSTDTYICRGDGPETWQPRFTFHGYRYVELTGLPTPPSIDAVQGVVLGSDTRSVGSFECSDPRINQLWSNIRWGQRGNFLSVPTDCPQRDERLGWTGDAQVFIGTAVYNADVAAFFTKWLVDVDDAQRPEGPYTNTVPNPSMDESGASGWSDAGVICPWTIYHTYGDKRQLARHLPGMMKWVDWSRAHSTNLIRDHDRGSDFGDWLSIGASTSKELLGTAYFAHCADLVSRSAKALGDEANAAKYAALFEDIKVAFRKKYFAADGSMVDGTQTTYALSLAFDLLPEGDRAAAAQRLADDVKAKGDHLSTGFLGVSYLLPALANHGQADIAYRLLFQDSFPSWLFSIKHGATTIWERWDGWTPEKGFQDAGMNSFNHYSLGSCGQWMYSSVAGIAQAPGESGFGRLAVKPLVGGGLSHVAASYDSIRGKIATAWHVKDGQLALDVTVPANVVATITVPTASPADVAESGVPAAKASGVKAAGTPSGSASFEVGSGTYHFTAKAP